MNETLKIASPIEELGLRFQAPSITVGAEHAVADVMSSGAGAVWNAQAGGVQLEAQLTEGAAMSKATDLYDLSVLSWQLQGFTPFQWKWGVSMETGEALSSELTPIPTGVPRSVQGALRDAGLLPDWNLGMNSRECEWVEHRHWMYETVLPDDWLEEGQECRAECLGLDGSGWAFLNGQEVGRFANSFIPHFFDLTAAIKSTGNRLQIVFDCPPRWLGQYGFTSEIRDFKPRFNYTWDWCPRLVQIGIWDRITVQVGPVSALASARCWTEGGSLHIAGTGEDVRLTVSDGDQVIREDGFDNAVTWSDLPVQRWWPNGHGDQPLYTVTCEAGDGSDARTWRVGFKSVEWQPCDGAPPEADPWLCVMNGRPVFLQGVNWTPILPNFADVTEEDYRKRLTAYRDMGCNILRVWGGAVLEKEFFYSLCDELGLMVWQEFPLSSSGMDNWPPEDETVIDEMERVARSYIIRRQHHVSLLIWCGGNELQGGENGKVGIGRPVNNSHPMMARLKQVVEEIDPTHRFLPTSSSGPRFIADANAFSQGLHWDVHGPWNVAADGYWEQDDALFRSEMGVPGASPVEVIRMAADGADVLPASAENPLWRRFSWWLQWDAFLAEQGREPSDIEAFVTWSQTRQADALKHAVRICKSRFPRCGGVILWMGHDCFPCMANTSIMDVNGDFKPAGESVAKVFK